MFGKWELIKKNWEVIKAVLYWVAGLAILGFFVYALMNGK